MVEAPGVEPGSESGPLKRLRDIRWFVSPAGAPSGRLPGWLFGLCSRLCYRPTSSEASPYLWHPIRDHGQGLGRALADYLCGKSVRVIVRVSQFPACLTRQRDLARNFSFNTPVEAKSPPFGRLRACLSARLYIVPEKRLIWIRFLPFCSF